ncbi:MAG: hypothetical protein ACOVQN_08965 [Exiguobacterium sp.]|jgi:hypothetical protein
MSAYIERLQRCDPTLDWINFTSRRHTDWDVARVVDYLSTHPVFVKRLCWSRNRFTNKTGVKLAQFLSGSTTIEYLSLHNNRFSETTYLAIAAALRVNTTLRTLHLFNEILVDWTIIDAAFVYALRLNPIRPDNSRWRLYSDAWNALDYIRLKTIADTSTPPSMLEFLLCVHLNPEKNKTKIH